MKVVVVVISRVALCSRPSRADLLFLGLLSSGGVVRRALLRVLLFAPNRVFSNPKEHKKAVQKWSTKMSLSFINV